MREHGIDGMEAPELGVAQWFDPSGAPAARLPETSARFRIIYCFQAACPGCHSSGFPALARIHGALGRRPEVSIVAVQTVFEELEHNTLEETRALQQRYALPIWFGHDDGGGQGSTLMKRYRNGGTPWFIIIDDGVVLANGFQINPDALIRHIEEQLSAATALPPGVLDWRGVLALARRGNPPPPHRLQKTDAEWRAQLTPEAYQVARRKGTERPHSSDLCRLFEPGRYACVCCGTPLFDATAKFDSGTGWPSFTQTLTPGVVAYHADGSHGMERIETTCNVCDAHLGHVFPDGPPPSRLRYCINAVSLRKLHDE